LDEKGLEINLKKGAEKMKTFSEIFDEREGKKKGKVIHLELTKTRFIVSDACKFFSFIEKMEETRQEIKTYVSDEREKGLAAIELMKDNLPNVSAFVTGENYVYIFGDSFPRALMKMVIVRALKIAFLADFKYVDYFELDNHVEIK